MSVLGAGNKVVFRHWLALGGLILLFAFMVPGCGGGGSGSETSGGGDADGEPALTETQMRQQFIQTVGDGFILPTYTMMEQAADELGNSVEAFCDSPNQNNLAAAQGEWRQVVGLWVEAEMVLFGPALRNRLHDEVDVPRGGHADASDIERRIAGSGDATPRHFTDERGIEGIEYLLFGDMDTDNAILAGYDIAGTAGQRRCTYLRAAADDLHDNITAIFDIWRAGGDNFLEDWNSAGDPDNQTYPFVQDAVNDLIDRMQFVLEDLVHSRLGGHSSLKRQSRRWVDGMPESWRSAGSIANIRHRLEAAEAIYLGTDLATDQDGFGIDEYLERTGEADLASRIRAQFDASFNAVNQIPETLQEAVRDPQSLATVVEAERITRDLLGLIKRDMGEHLDVFFGFNDADGD